MRDEEPDAGTLEELAGLEGSCTRCPLYRGATQAVAGEGRAYSRLMLVGEQPGDREDREGRPFVGPAGQVLDRALDEAGVPRREVFVTNAVKHFKYEQRGKRRLHKRPNANEIERCKWWLDTEIRLVRPAVIVAMGATAARSVVGRGGTIGSLRGSPLPLAEGRTAFVTIHPSYLLRMRDEMDRAFQYKAFVDDLQRSWRTAQS